MQNDDCPTMGDKIVEQEMTCQIMYNCSATFMILLLYLIFGLLLKLAVALLRLDDSKSYAKLQASEDLNNSRLQLMADKPKLAEAKPTFGQKLRILAVETSRGMFSRKAGFMLLQSFDIDLILSASINLKYYTDSPNPTAVHAVNRLVAGTVFAVGPVLIVYFFFETKKVVVLQARDSYLLEGRKLEHAYHRYREIFVLARNYTVCVLVIWLYDSPIL